MAFQRFELSVIAVCFAVTSGCSDVPAVFHCKASSACRSGEICILPAGKCVKPSELGDAGDAVGAACMNDGDCPATNACEDAHCVDGICKSTPKDADFMLPDDQLGDCQVNVCDGDGKLISRADDSDVPRDSGGPCHKQACNDGKPDTSPVADGQACNGNGTCKNGECSSCKDGDECTARGDCTVHLSSCDADTGKYSCNDTQVPIDGKSCGDGKICSGGACTECTVGATCEGGTACRVRQVTSCSPQRVCQPVDTAGMPCGKDASGNAMACNAGECTYDCAPGDCATSDNPCAKVAWVCSEPHSPGACVQQPLDDGSSCGTDQFCHNGTCQHTALANGGFMHGIDGWTLTGDANEFLVAQDPDNDRRWSISTWVANAPGGGDAATGTVSQMFVVPADALALRFNIFGGHAVVRLEDSNHTQLQQVAGPDSNDVRVPVSWDLTQLRGQRVELVIDDSLTQPNWNFVGVTGFDLIRADVPPLKNSQWDGPVTQGWDLTADAAYWNIFLDYNYGGTGGVDGVGDPAYGRRRGLSSYVRDTAAAHVGVTATGTVSQTFVVPPDAVALRFNVYGGKIGQVSLYESSTQLIHVNGFDTNAVKTPVSWDLSAYRGHTLKLEIADMGASGTTDYVGSSGFDLITSYNGP